MTQAGELADLHAVAWRTIRRMRPPPRISLSAWADRHFRLSAESAAEPGRWRTLPYQRGIMDAISDPDIERVTVKKSARVGYTKMINAAIAFHMAHDPCPILVVQPTIDNAKIYSKEEIAPMLRDVEVLDGLVSEQGVKATANTVAHKTFPGGVLSMVGANSGRGFRMISRRVVIFDEVDAYPPSAGNDGDPVKLGEKRSEYYWNRKIIAGSTPLVAGVSRIEEMFEAGDQRRYYVPCPHCKHMDYLRFSLRDEEELGGGHVMRWPTGHPEKAFFVCNACGCSIEETNKYAMLEAGEWRAKGKETNHASFHIWTAYSMSPNATWGAIAAEFVAAGKDPLKLKTFVNTTLGQTWKDRGEAPDWEILHARRESYAIGKVPAGALWLTGGVDVQKDRLVYELVAWGEDKESWSVEAGELHGDTALEASEQGSPWGQLDVLLARGFPAADGSGDLPIAKLAVDSGYNTQAVYNWCRGHSIQRVIACKGVSGPRALVGAASTVDVKWNGKRWQRGYRVFPIGVDIAKSEFYAWLRLRIGAGGTPPGFCHFPDHPEEYFKQLTAEHLVTVVNQKTRRPTMGWHVLPNRENHYLDARILARVAAALLGIDRLTKPKSGVEDVARFASAVAHAQGAAKVPGHGVPRNEPPPLPRAPRRESWLGGGGPVRGRRRGGWLK